jgi:uncharacterized HAD superfamily protein
MEVESYLKYVIDIDGTICTQEDDYEDAKPLKENIERFNKLYDEGHTVWYFTARGTETGIDWTETTKTQFEKWGVKYHELLFGKPSADVYIDDRCENINK